MKKSMRPSRVKSARILIVTGIFPPDDGGPATYVPLIARTLQSRGFKPEVITYSNSNADADNVGYRVFRISRGLPYPARTLLALVLIFWRGLFSDLLYINGLYGPSAIALFFLRKPSCAKYVGDPCWERVNAKGWFRGSIDEFQCSSGTFSRLARWARSTAARQFGKIIVPSAYLSRLVGGWGIELNRLSVVLNAVPTTPPLPRRGGPKSGRLIVISRLVPHKQVEQVIRVVISRPEWSLTVVGDGPLKAQLEDVVSHERASSRISFLGVLPRTQLLQLLSTADLLVLNSSYEGLPHVVLEATACGVPVIVRDSGGTAESVIENSTGTLVRDTSDSSLEKAIIDGLLPGSFPDFNSGQKDILAKFSQEQMLNATLGLLESCLTAKS